MPRRGLPPSNRSSAWASIVLPAPVSPVITFSPRSSASSALSMRSRLRTRSSASTALRLSAGSDVAGGTGHILQGFVPTRTRTGLDVVVVGASISGCTAARLFALAGARVALAERRQIRAPTRCLHARHSLQRGADDRAARSGRAAGCARRRAHAPGGLDATRRHGSASRPTLPTDTASRGPRWTRCCGSWRAAHARRGPPAWVAAAVGLLGDRGRVAGVELEDPPAMVGRSGPGLVVGADGRHSAVARLAQMRGRVRPNNRFFYFAYSRGVRPPRPTRACGCSIRRWRPRSQRG